MIKIKSIFSFILIILLTDIDDGYSQRACHGILEAHMYRPSTQGAFEKKLYVYLLKDYHITAKAYPVVYLLHGANGNERSWLDNGMILHYIDSLTSSAAC